MYKAFAKRHLVRHHGQCEMNSIRGKNGDQTIYMTWGQSWGQSVLKMQCWTMLVPKTSSLILLTSSLDPLFEGGWSVPKTHVWHVIQFPSTAVQISKSHTPTNFKYEYPPGLSTDPKHCTPKPNSSNGTQVHIFCNFQHHHSCGCWEFKRYLLLTPNIARPNRTAPMELKFTFFPLVCV